jgi:hypothetical protein
MATTTTTSTTANNTSANNTSAYAGARVVQPYIYNNGPVPTATLVEFEPAPMTTTFFLQQNSKQEIALLDLPTGTIVVSDDDDMSDASSLLFSINDGNSSMSSSSSQQATTTRTKKRIDDQLQQLLKRSTPETSRELQELVSCQQPSFDVAPQPNYNDMKARRKTRQVVTAVTGGAVGLVTLGPLGLCIGVLGGAVITKGVSKAQERKVLQSYEERTKHLDTVPARLGELV